MGGGYTFWLGASADAETGSREPGLASRPGPAGFDPARCKHLQSEIARLPLSGHYARLCTICGAVL